MNTINGLKNQVDKLQKRDPAVNQHIIAKLKRRIRALERK